ncbi:hypothetical protein ACWT_3219 [Actinoplanes sp. SE50]|uniref:hypothetical protein n=1 Tax=unclassified Actinoplanes TaxID=2626549 RepID=UPI00023EC962|nr:MULTISPECIES: hypothetical protein [unclassified Actinoplanes]AEV84242.1 hypothetical protein ACPL_3347 [Actinoplanes sp. SE50/110]ATO82634.1 hypothetical protein ACWT_3219 [Actinoplanes sp. SE50]SLM00041.1 hypothetical protein ACSP50_3273 [Actinoplanes sp. SE50/110]
MGDSVEVAAIVDALPGQESVRRLVRQELADTGREHLLDDAGDDQGRSALIAALDECLRQNPDFGWALRSALAPEPVAEPVPRGYEPPAGPPRRWMPEDEVRRRWPTIRDTEVGRVAAAHGVDRWFRQTGPATGLYGTGAPGTLMFDTDGVERVATGLASGELRVRPEQRTDTGQGRDAHRRVMATAIVVGLVVLALCGLLGYLAVQSFRHPASGSGSSNCGDCGWH